MISSTVEFISLSEETSSRERTAEGKKENAKMRTPGTRVSHETAIVPVKVKIVLTARQKSIHKITCRYFC